MLKTRIPPPLYVLAVALAMYGISYYLPMPIDSSASRWGWVFSLLGLMLTGWAGVTFRRSHTTFNPLQPSKASQLVIHGPFRFTRNPMYLGFVLMLTGCALSLDNCFACLGIPLFTLIVTFLQIIPEERALQGRFGQEYDQYLTRVNRWIGPIKLIVPGRDPQRR